MQFYNTTYAKAAIQDITIIRQLAIEIWNEHYPGIISQKQIDYMLELMYAESALKKQIETGHEFHVMYTNEIPIGYIAFHQEEEFNWFIDKFYIKKQYRGFKLGENFFNYTENIILKKRAHTLRLYVNRENYKSVNFYFKCGFIIESVIDKPIGEGYYMNDFIMVKKYTI